MSKCNSCEVDLVALLFFKHQFWPLGVSGRILKEVTSKCLSFFKWANIGHISRSEYFDFGLATSFAATVHNFLLCFMLHPNNLLIGFHFPRFLYFINRDEIRDKMNSKYLSRDDYNFEKVNRASLACGPMVKWCIAQVRKLLSQFENGRNAMLLHILC